MADDELARLRTARLHLRRFRETDVDAFARYRSDPAVARYQRWDAERHHLTRQAARIRQSLRG